MIERLGPDRFRVDFARESGGLWGKIRAAFGAEQAAATIDPYKVGQAVCAAMRHSKERDVDGRILAWNEYRIYLSRADFDRLRPLAGRIQARLDTLIRNQLQQMNAETVGEPVIRLLVDEASDLPAGTAEILVAYSAALEPLRSGGGPGEVTIRVGRPLLAEQTQRVADPAGALPGAWTVRWPGGSAALPRGRRVELGRPHDDAPQHFIALEGADERVNRVQLAIEVQDGAVEIYRHVRANPVQVQGRPLQPGGRIVPQGDPVEIVLSNGALTLRLSPAGGDA